jgi:hypothetical protein
VLTVTGSSIRFLSLAVASTFCLSAYAPYSLAGEESPTSPIEDYFDGWFDRVDRAQAAQPHWITPLATTTPRLEEEFRYDQYWETLPHGGGSIHSFGAGKGLELIPTEDSEIIVGLPPYMQRTGRDAHEGIGDMSFLLKYRLLKANESQGDYILTAFLQGSAPVGDRVFSSNHYGVTPTIAFGVGWNDFDLQTTLGETFPTGDVAKLGRPIALNTAFQYHVAKVLWPEFELNYTYWPDGARRGKSQLYVTPGIVFGRFPLIDRLRLIVGIGYQLAVAPVNPAFDHNWILSVRTAF